jgi:hypothetical protein
MRRLANHRQFIAQIRDGERRRTALAKAFEPCLE